jgi:hypothetical protein
MFLSTTRHFPIRVYKILRNTAIFGRLFGMDKLDKLPPKDVKSLRDNPIAQGIVSNTIFQVAWNGGSAVIGWLVGHYALLSGIPLHWAIVMGAVVFFLIALSYNLFRRGREAKQATAVANANFTGETESEAVERIGNQNDELQGELHLAEREIATLESEKGRLSREKEKLAKDLANEKANAEARQAERTGILIEKNMLADRVEELEGAIKVANQKLKQEEIQSANWTRLANEAERKLHELQWLVEILKPQESALQDHVVITELSQVRVDLIENEYGDPPRIRFGFKIRNEALADITIHTHGVGGHVSFKGRALAENTRFDPNLQSTVEDLKHKKDGWLFLNQEFTAAETDRIKEALSSNSNAEFSFEGVLIKVSSGKDFSFEATEPLKIPSAYRSIKLDKCKVTGNAINTLMEADIS